MELPLHLCALWLHPCFHPTALNVEAPGIVPLMLIRKLLSIYFCRCSEEFSGKEPHPHATSMSVRASRLGQSRAGVRRRRADVPENYPLLVRAAGDETGCRFCRHSRFPARVLCGAHFVILPNAADPERVFSFPGRMVTCFRTSLGDLHSRRMLVSSKDYRSNAKKKLEKTGVKNRAVKRMSDRAAMILKLRDVDKDSSDPLGDVATAPTPVEKNETP